jgi:ribosome biogenesis GTPase
LWENQLYLCFNSIHVLDYVRFPADISTQHSKSMSSRGRILKRIGDRYSVHDQGKDILCVVRKTVSKSDLPPAVGDWVQYSLVNKDSGVIEQVVDRYSGLTRRAAGKIPRPQVLLANLDLLVVVTPLAEPKPNPRLIDRFLAMAEYDEVPSVLVWNKIDLVSDYRTPLAQRYEKIGYLTLFTCALTGKGVDRLWEVMSGKTSMLLGSSGVGKTSLLNQLEPEIGSKVAAVSLATGKGIHTTSVTEIFPMRDDTYIADSPGVREFALWGVERLELGWCFREFRPYAEQCRFRDCVHDQEVGCAVKEAVERGDIDAERWDSYLRILHTL